jgi:hypothetical protein
MYGADECAWRKYPAAGPLRMPVDSPSCNEVADIIEDFVNCTLRCGRYAADTIITNRVGYEVYRSMYPNKLK